METLLLEPGDLLQVKSTDLPLGTFIKLQPQDPSFLEITDPKAVLENAFRNFSCLTTGDIFTFAYNDNVYSIAVLETRPEHATKAICTLETDLSVDFAHPGWLSRAAEDERDQHTTERQGPYGWQGRAATLARHHGSSHQLCCHRTIIHNGCSRRASSFLKLPYCRPQALQEGQQGSDSAGLDSHCWAFDKSSTDCSTNQRATTAQTGSRQALLWL